MDDARPLELPPAAAERYRDVVFVAAGGMGRVYRARDAKLARDVALKVVGDRDLGGDEGVRRFRREVTALTRVDHPNVVRCFDALEAGSRRILVMEFVAGETMADEIARGPLKPRRALGLVAGALDGLAAVHGAAILHRDLKPGNLVVTGDGATVKILDLGLSTFIGPETVTALTRTGDLLGTVRYLPPEVLGGGSHSPAGDLYQMGLVLAECLTGEFPLSSIPSLASLCPAQTSAPLDGIDPELRALCLRSFASDPADRFPSAAAFAAALREFRDRGHRAHSGGARRGSTKAARVGRVEPPSDSRGARRHESGASSVVRRRSVAAVAALAVAFALAWGLGRIGGTALEPAAACIDRLRANLLPGGRIEVEFTTPSAGELRFEARQHGGAMRPLNVASFGGGRSFKVQIDRDGMATDYRVVHDRSDGTHCEETLDLTRLLNAVLQGGGLEGRLRGPTGEQFHGGPAPPSRDPSGSSPRRIREVDPIGGERADLTALAALLAAPARAAFAAGDWDRERRVSLFRALTTLRLAGVWMAGPEATGDDFAMVAHMCDEFVVTYDLDPPAFAERCAAAAAVVRSDPRLRLAKLRPYNLCENECRNLERLTPLVVSAFDMQRTHEFELAVPASADLQGRWYVAVQESCLTKYVALELTLNDELTVYRIGKQSRIFDFLFYDRVAATGEELRSKEAAMFPPQAFEIRLPGGLLRHGPNRLRFRALLRSPSGMFYPCVHAAAVGPLTPP